MSDQELLSSNKFEKRKAVLRLIENAHKGGVESKLKCALILKDVGESDEALGLYNMVVMDQEVNEAIKGVAFFQSALIFKEMGADDMYQASLKSALSYDNIEAHLHAGQQHQEAVKILPAAKHYYQACKLGDERGVEMLQGLVDFHQPAYDMAKDVLQDSKPFCSVKFSSNVDTADALKLEDKRPVGHFVHVTGVIAVINQKTLERYVACGSMAAVTKAGTLGAPDPDAGPSSKP